MVRKAQRGRSRRLLWLAEGGWRFSGLGGFEKGRGGEGLRVIGNGPQFILNLNDMPFSTAALDSRRSERSAYRVPRYLRRLKSVNSPGTNLLQTNSCTRLTLASTDAVQHVRSRLEQGCVCHSTYSGWTRYIHSSNISLIYGTARE